MKGWSEALLTYGLTIIIAFGIAGIIQIIVVLLEKFSPKEGN